MRIQKQDLYEGHYSKSPQHKQNQYIKWYQIMNIQKQDLHDGS